LDKDLEQGDHACSQVKSHLSPISAGSREIVSSQKRLKKIISEIFEQNSSIWGESNLVPRAYWLLGEAISPGYEVGERAEDTASSRPTLELE
jgi:hypothetical protein